jgi:hypothetical protein
MFSTDDEKAKRKAKTPEPDWVKSPQLRQMLLVQSTWNPDDIFGSFDTPDVDLDGT